MVRFLTLSSADVLLVESQGAIRIVRMNRPDALNAANPELHTRLAKRLV